MRGFMLASLGLVFLLAGAATALGFPQRLSDAPGTGAAPDFACTVKPAPCEAGEVEVLRMSSLSNAHAGLPGFSTHGQALCCTGLTGLGTDCSGTHDIVLDLSATDNAHVASDGSYENHACLSLEGEGTVECVAVAGCGEGYVCAATISDSTNAHVADCGAQAYATKVCCQALPDNCPDVQNPDQLNSDEDDSGGDVCDPCPNDDKDNCNTDRSAGESIGPEGGSIVTPDESVAMTVPAGALQGETSISMTGDTRTGFMLATTKGKASGVFQVDIQPSGQQFAVPVTIVFAWEDTNNDGRVDGTGIREPWLYVAKDGGEVTLQCPDEPGCDMDANTFTFEISSLSDVVLAAPLDTDDDEVPDWWDDVRDNCPEVPNLDQADGDEEGLGDACDPCAADPDCDDDDFSDFQESYMGTDLQDDCPDDSGDDAWPPDMDNDTDADIVDVLAAFKDKVLIPAAYDERSDFDADGDLDIVDVIVGYKQTILTSCTP